LPQIKAGKLRALAVGTPQRLSELPGVPTLQEEGVKDFEATTPSALLAPAKTPPEVIRVLSDALARALADPAVRAKLKALGSEIRVTTPAELDAFMAGEEKKLKALHAKGVLKAG
jgi:tripartite-type tricarboxylate transporter receptor subunit TctC